MICSFLAGLHGTRQEEMIDHRLTDREWAEEWKHLDHVRHKYTLTYNCLKGALLRQEFKLFLLKKYESLGKLESVVKSRGLMFPIR